MLTLNPETKVSPAPPSIDDDIASLVGELAELENSAAGLGPSLITPCSLHDSHGRLIWMSKMAANLLGADGPSDGAPTSGANDLLKGIHVQDRVEFAHFAGSSEKSPVAESIEFRVLPKFGTAPMTKWMETRRKSITGAKSGQRFWLLTYRDVTKLKQSELEAIRVGQNAEEASKAKSSFLANISHELRTPLNAILGFSELMNSPLITTCTEEKQREYAGLIQDSARHLLNVLNGILDMSKIENGMYEIFPESFDIARCLENTVAMMSGQANLANIRLHLTGQDCLPDIIADEKAIKQVLINLLSNAIKFSETDGSVWVTAERKARSVHLTIKDEGVGISPEHLADLGKPFFQADSKYDRKFEGTGLGLSIVKGLIELHGGTVSFKSRRGEGTTVSVSIPVNCKPGHQVPASETVDTITALPRREETVPNVARILRNTA